MTTIKISLPGELAQEAEQAGVLTPESLEKWVRQQLKAKQFDQLVAAVDRMSAVNDLPYMSPEEVAEKKVADSLLSVDQLVAPYVDQVMLVRPAYVPRLAPDPDDDVVIGTAIAANVDFIVTGTTDCSL
jgi:predicted nucleic acid-binding protein